MYTEYRGREALELSPKITMQNQQNWGKPIKVPSQNKAQPLKNSLEKKEEIKITVHIIIIKAKLQSLKMLSKAVVILLAVFTAKISSAPLGNTQGLPNTQCTLGMPHQPSLGEMKSIACLMETIVLEPLKNPDIPSFDVFRPSNMGSTNFNQELSDCVSEICTFACT